MGPGYHWHQQVLLGAATLINFLLNEEAWRFHHGFRVRHPRFQGWSGC